MTDSPTPPVREQTFGEATRQAWRRSSTGLTRYASFAVGALIMLGVHVALIVVTGNAWSWLAVVALPPAAYFLLAGFVYGRVWWRVLGLALFVVGAMLPFYLM
ncbi:MULTISPECIES: hypothetical protein [unclassified Nocardioides]|uniref:hypothetical protein n=1 Tax=unclassified Nocardioides TaxID=2615069 RepID=UPI0009F04EF3|nr:MULTISPECIES: hypothetical protein [unclassified Nocardioides]GAW49978.1 Nitroreductase family protein [Nocardioides sp. PD653-B2]GAW55929.1 Nitroreductase family protein [Nocardioides sp. PD653]